MSHVTHMNESCHTYEWVMSHVWMGHVTHMTESCHTYEWVMSHIWMSHVTRMNESCRAYEWVMSHIWMSHVTHMTESCQTYEWVMSHKRRSHVTHMKTHTNSMRYAKVMRVSHVTHTNESCHTHDRVMSNIWTSHVTHECVMSHKWKHPLRVPCAVSKSCGWVMSHIRIGHVTRMQTHSFETLCAVTKLCEWVMTHSYVWHDLLTWLWHSAWYSERQSCVSDKVVWVVTALWQRYSAVPCRSQLLQNIVSFIGLFCKRDLSFCAVTTHIALYLVAHIWMCIDICTYISDFGE